jgi:O-antigen ligase
MYLETAQIVQLSAAIIAAIVILVAAYGAPLRVSVAILLVFIPFQPVETRLGSANIVMTYVLFGALLLRRRLQYLPMLGAFAAVILAYLLSMSQLNRALYADHGLYLFFVVSGFLVFFLAYNLARESNDPRFIINIFIAANIASILYCLVQFTVGPGERLIFFGLNELWMHRNRGGGDPRLVGPFGTPGLTAAYFMSMTVMLTYEIMNSRHLRKVGLIALAATNVAMMAATANRGSFLVLLASMLLFLYLFRAQLGVKRIFQILVVSSVVLFGATALIAAYSDFGQMFSRLETTTEFTGGLPDTRQRVWPQAWRIVPEKPWLGHGPKLAMPHQVERRSIHPEQLVLDYPHNLYLYLLVTVGIVGTMCMVYFLFSIAWKVWRAASRGIFDNEYEKGWVLVGALVIIGFLVDQLKIEFLRAGTIDYAHFIFALFGVFLGWADRAKANARARASLSPEKVGTYQDSDSRPAFAREGRT